MAVAGFDLSGLITTIVNLIMQLLPLIVIMSVLPALLAALKFA